MWKMWKCIRTMCPRSKKNKPKFYDLPIATNQYDKILLFQEKDWKAPIEEDYVRKE